MATKRRREEKEEEENKEGEGTLGSPEEKEYQAYIASMCSEDLSDELLFDMPEFRSKVWLHDLLQKGRGGGEYLICLVSIFVPLLVMSTRVTNFPIKKFTSLMKIFQIGRLIMWRMV